MKMCVFAQSGKCKHGSQCRFAHSVDELRPMQPAVADVPSAAFQAIEEEPPQKDFFSLPALPSQTYPLQQDSQGTGGSTATGNGGSSSGQSSNENSGSAPSPRTRAARVEADPQSSEDRSRASLPCSSWNERNYERNENSDGSSWASVNSSVTAVPRSEHTGTGSPPATSDSSSSGAGNGQATSSTAGPRAGASPEQPKSSSRRPARSSGSSDQSVAPQQVTTLLISNVPTYLTQGALLSTFEDLTTPMRGNFDFFYCPWDHKAGHNFGYALINFTDPSHAAEFQQRWTSKELFRSGRGHKPLRVVKASLQGLQANIGYFHKIEIGGSCADVRFRPLYRDDEGNLQHLELSISTSAETEPSVEVIAPDITQQDLDTGQPQGDAGTGASVARAGPTGHTPLSQGSDFRSPQDDRNDVRAEPRRRGRVRKRRPDTAVEEVYTPPVEEVPRLRPRQQPLPQQPVPGVEPQELRQLSLQQQQQQLLKIMEHHEEMKRKQLQQREERKPAREHAGSSQLQSIQAQQLQLLAAQQQLLQKKQSVSCWPSIACSAMAPMPDGSTHVDQVLGLQEPTPPVLPMPMTFNNCGMASRNEGQFMVSRAPSDMQGSSQMAVYMARQSMQSTAQTSLGNPQQVLNQPGLEQVFDMHGGSRGASQCGSMMVPYMMLPIQAMSMQSTDLGYQVGRPFAGRVGTACGTPLQTIADEVYTD